ncbi:MAG: glycosyltransferase [Candidatus Angelobacter sp.]
MAEPNRQLSILHLITTIACGGAENQLQQLVQASDGRLFCHTVVSLHGGGPIADELKAMGVEVHSLGLKRGSLSLSGMVRLVPMLRRLRPDVLHCWMYHACLMGAAASRMARTPSLVWGLRAAHTDLSDYSFMTRSVIRLCARMSSWPQAIVVNSRTAREAHRLLGYNTRRMKVIPNGIDTRQFAPSPESRCAVRQELGLRDDHVLVGMFSRFDPMKDHASFFRAAAAVHQHYPAARFLLAGVGITADNAALMGMVSENSLQDATFLLGQRRDIPRLSSALDVACLSSWTESFPNVVLEAMSCGVPCVVTDAGDSASIVGDTGRIVPVRDTDALAEALAALVGMDFVQRAALGQKARERMLHCFAVERAVQEYESLYQECAGSGGLNHEQPDGSAEAM